MVGIDSNGYHEADPSDFDVTWSQIIAKQKELQTAYDNNKYQRDRAEAYPSIADQLDDLYITMALMAGKQQSKQLKISIQKG